MDESEKDLATVNLNPFGDPDVAELNPFGDPDSEGSTFFLYFWSLYLVKFSWFVRTERDFFVLF